MATGGLLYLTCTDGLASSGRTPWTALCEYGSFTAPVPFANEQVRYNQQGKKRVGSCDHNDDGKDGHVGGGGGGGW